MYEVRDFDAMLADPVRTSAYLEAIRLGVRRGSVVVEIGTGVGFFAVAACRAGARRVYAIDLNPAIELGARVAADNGCADRVTFVHADSRRVTLPEPGDLLLSDLRGVLPLFTNHIPTLVDARRRLVRPGATLLPRRDTLWAAPCEAPPSWARDHARPGDTPYGIDRRAVAERVRSDWHRCHLEPSAVLADGVTWATLDYATIEAPDAAGRAAWTIERDGAADGVAVWFDADLASGITFSNAPSAPRALYGQAFFPFQQALDVRTGDALAVAFRAHLIEGDYVWAWDTTLTRHGDDAHPVSFRQSNLASGLVSLDVLRRHGADHRPSRTASADACRTMLGLVDGARTIGAIAAALRDAHPLIFPDAASAQRFATARLAALELEDDRTSSIIPSTD